MGLYRPQDQDTICALATPAGQGALALVRLSGKTTFSLAKKMCSFLPPKPISHHLYFGMIKDPIKKEPIDEVLVACFTKGHSFTNEDCVEISCHGGTYIFSKILEVLIKLGARLAEKGEFSYRAFMNGRIDLLQAESVLELIKSRTPRAHRQALKMLRGDTSKQCLSLKKHLINILAHLEANLDFCEEDIAPYSKEEQKRKLKNIECQVSDLLEGYHQGQLNKRGVSVAIVGEVNVGKSSLFNALIKEDQAIVSPHPGTTRDQVIGSIMIKQGEFVLKDCAGFRSKPGEIEEQGIAKTIHEIKEATLIVFLVEAGSFSKESLLGFKELLKNQKTNPSDALLVMSKSDKLKSLKDRAFFLEKIEQGFLKSWDNHLKTYKSYRGREKEYRNRLKLFIKNALWLSVKTKEALEDLKNWLGKVYENHSGDIFLVNPRQFQYLNQMKSRLRKAQTLLQKGASEEFVVFELRQALESINSLLGESSSINSSDIVDKIFQEFCIGK